MKYLLCSILLSLSCNASTGLSASVGKVTGKLGTTSARVAIFSESYNEWLSSYLNHDTFWTIELSHAHWNNQYFEDIKVTTLTPSVKIYWLWQEQALFASLGVGAAYLTETRFSSRRLGSNWLFEDKLSVGWKMTKQHSVSLSINHYSNANFASVNDGSTFVFLDYSYQW